MMTRREGWLDQVGGLCEGIHLVFVSIEGAVCRTDDDNGEGGRIRFGDC